MRTLPQKFYESRYTGQEATVEVAPGVFVEFTPQGLKEYIESTAPASVASFNGAVGDVVVQTEDIADATDDVDIITQFNTLLAALRSLNILVVAEEE